MQAVSVNRLVLFTGGGTAGHVFPALAILDQLVQVRDVDVEWVGGSAGMERSLVESHRIEQEIGGPRVVPYHGIPTGKLRRYLSVRNVVDLFKVVGGLVASIWLIARRRPLLLFSKGGFVSVPPVIAAALAGVPVITHESDADPGLATRIHARFASRILVAYPGGADHFPPAQRSKVVVTGNPIRRAILEGTADEGLGVAGFAGSDTRPVVMFLGGSLGAKQINQLVADISPRILRNWRVIHQTGDPTALQVRDGQCYSRAFFATELPGLLA
ncbi:MAG: hypothetical protein E4H09_04585, partial [Spirochaetales bacterium]